ncbi:MAG: carbohydrate-binding family 9-like protein [Elusimicrobia bacterium]|nr:carbohydrate-binding family 9-like protein [Elusimicrobiota bacterium]
MKKIVYECNYINTPIKIDGLLNEPAWKKAKVLNFFEINTRKKPISKTEGRLLWDKKYLYIGYKAYDKDIWGYFKKRNDPTCQEDVLELFIKTNPKNEPYYNFEINPLGTIYDAFSPKMYAGGEFNHRWNRWDCPGIKRAVFIKGTLNNWHDVDEYWQLEVAIPFKSLETLNGKIPDNGDEWKFHLSRYDYSVYLPNGVELSSCSPFIKNIDFGFHMSEGWINLKFKR